jgi:hypothetical protein
MFHRNSLISEFYPVEDDDGSLIPCWAIFQSETETFVGTSDGVRIIDGAPNHPLVKITNGMACYSGIFGEGFSLIGTASDGIYRFSNSNTKRVFFNNKEALDNTIIYMIKNSIGFIACTKRSFVQLDKNGEFLFQRVYNEVPMASYAMWIEQVEEGYRCASTTGICWLTDDLKQKHMSRHDNARVFNMCDDSVCVSMDGGLYILNPDSTLVQSSFPDNQLLSIINKEWVSATNSIYQITDAGSRSYNYQNGFPLREYNQGGYMIDNEGNMLFSGVGGVFRFNPDSVQSMPELPKLAICRQGVLCPTNNALNIPYDQGFLNLNLELLQLSDNNLFQVFKMIDGDTIIMSEMGNLQFEIDYGMSELQFIVANIENNETSILTIQVERAYPFWMNWWFLVFMGVVVISLLLGMYSAIKFFQTKRLLQMQKAENKVNQERLRISKELHDNIGARLTHIISSLDMEMYRAKSNSNPSPSSMI